MRFIPVTHANSKEAILLNPDQVFYISHSPAHKCTLIASPAGAYCLVTESPDAVLKSWQEARQHNSQELKMSLEAEPTPVETGK